MQSPFPLLWPPSKLTVRRPSGRAPRTTVRRQNFTGATNPTTEGLPSLSLVTYQLATFSLLSSTTNVFYVSSTRLFRVPPTYSSCTKDDTRRHTRHPSGSRLLVQRSWPTTERGIPKPLPPSFEFVMFYFFESYDHRLPVANGNRKNNNPHRHLSLKISFSFIFLTLPLSFVLLNKLSFLDVPGNGLWQSTGNPKDDKSLLRLT